MRTRCQDDRICVRYGSTTLWILPQSLVVVLDPVISRVVSELWTCSIWGRLVDPLAVLITHILNGYHCRHRNSNRIAMGTRTAPMRVQQAMSSPDTVTSVAIQVPERQRRACRHICPRSVFTVKRERIGSEEKIRAATRVEKGRSK